jgi:DNA-binding winged helix-turn-helix (wHTH) protein/tetratricopeptide (TPR) repeat protein
MEQRDRREQPPPDLVFGEFRLDRGQGRLLANGAPVALRPKAWRVLCHLAERAGKVVSANDVLDAIWPHTAVTPQTLTNVISELRTALGDDTRGPRFLETVPRKGYRFTAALEIAPPTSHTGQPVVGRDVERARLSRLWAKVCTGQRCTVLLSGEAGIGKTTLAQLFAAEHVANEGKRPTYHLVAECTDGLGVPEPYGPLLVAIADLARREAAVPAVLERFAPTWLVQLPWLTDAAKRADLEREVRGAPSTRMLREGVALLEALATSRPLLLVMEDLHWADDATAEVALALARRSPPAALMLLGTYRPGDLVERTHPIGTALGTLRRRQAIVEIDLVPLDAAAVRSYLRARLRLDAPPAELVAMVELHSGGNPLFMRSVTDQLSSGVDSAARAELPASLQDLVDADLARLSETRRAQIESASILGDRISIEEVAAATGGDIERTEQDLLALARIGRLIRAEPELGPAGSSGNFRFVHSVYRRAVTMTLTPRRRRTLHLRAAAALEALHGDRLDEVATRLAGHLRAAGDGAAARRHLVAAATNAGRRFAYGDAVRSLRDALHDLEAEPATPDRHAEEAALYDRLGSALVLARGYSDPEVMAVWMRAIELYDQQGETRGRMSAGLGLTAYLLTAARIADARHETTALITLGRSAVTELLPVAFVYAAMAASLAGDLRDALNMLDLASHEDPHPDALSYFDVLRLALSQRALVLTEMGDLEGARTTSEHALARSERVGILADRAHGALSAVEATILRRDRGAARPLIETAAGLCHQHGLPSFSALATFYEGWLICGGDALAGIARMQGALEARQAIGDRWHTSMLLGLLAEAKLAHGDVDGASKHLADAQAFAAASGERHFEPELRRIDGECMRARGEIPAATQAFRDASALAGTMGAALWVRRAAASLERVDPSA